MNVTKLAKECGRSKVIIYRLAKRLGRLPTKDEVLNRPVGRPRKYN